MKCFLKRLSIVYLLSLIGRLKPVFIRVFLSLVLEALVPSICGIELRQKFDAGFEILE